MRPAIALWITLAAAAFSLPGCDAGQFGALSRSEQPASPRERSLAPQWEPAAAPSDRHQAPTKAEDNAVAAREEPAAATGLLERPQESEGAADGQAAPEPMPRTARRIPPTDAPTEPPPAPQAAPATGTAELPASAAPVATAVERLTQLSNAFSQVAETIQPTVVQVLAEVRVSQLSGRGGGVQFQQRRLRPEDFFAPFGESFDLEPDNRPRSRRSTPGEYAQYDVPQPVGAGSGWIYDDEGHIVTSRHVVADADVISVRFFDGSETRAEIVGVDPPTDVAVLQIDARRMPQSARRVQLAKQAVKPGDIVFAVGSPFEYAFSVSQGIVSATERVVGILGPQGYENFIQTDAAINPGNSGGPLTNVRGEVVGMNTAIASQSGAFAGIGFATPVSMVRDVAEELIRAGKVSRGYLGAMISDDRRLLATFGTERGVVIEDVTPDSPAVRAGLRPGDVILAIGDRPLRSAAELRRTVAGKDPGDVIRLALARDGEQLRADVTLAELPTDAEQDERQRRQPPEEEAEAKSGDVLLKLGLQRLAPMSRPIAQQTGLDYAPGVLVLDVRQFSVAHSAGISQGDIVTDVMGQAVTTPEELRERLASSNLADGVRIRLRIPAGHSRFAVLTLP